MLKRYIITLMTAMMMVGASQEIGAMGCAVETQHNTRSRGKKDTSLHRLKAPRKKRTARVIVQPAETSVIDQAEGPAVQQDAVTMASLSAVAVQTEPQLADEKIAALVQQNTILSQRVGILEELMQSRAGTNSTFALYLMGEILKLTQIVDSVAGRVRALGDRTDGLGGKVEAIESLNALMYPVPPDINHTPDAPF